MNVAASFALLVIAILGSCTSLFAATPAEFYRRATSMLASVPNTPGLETTFVRDPRVLGAIGEFLQGADAENLKDAEMRERFAMLVPYPPWTWTPAFEVHRVRPGLHLAAISQAPMGGAGGFYLFDRGRWTDLDPEASCIAGVAAIHSDGGRIEVAYYPTLGSTAPKLKSIVLERQGDGWHVDRDTPYARAAATLARVPRDAMGAPDVHVNPLVLQAFGMFLANAGRLPDSALHTHMSGIFPVEWHQQWPPFDIRRIGPTLYLVTIVSMTPSTQASSLHLFDGATYTWLASDDSSWIFVEKADVSDRRIVVTYEASSQPSLTSIVEKRGTAWRLVPTP